MNEPLTHTLLIGQAALWLRSQKCVVVITDLSHYGSETPDAIGWQAGGWSTLVECKASRSDFLADRKKPFRRYPEQGMGNHRYYLAPQGMLKPEELPEKWGLLEWTGKRVIKTKESQSFGSDWQHCGDRQEMSVMVSAMRRLGQQCQRGLSVKAYTYDSKCRATVGVETEATQA